MEELTPYSDTKLAIEVVSEPLSSDFSCGNAVMDRFLIDDAFKCHQFRYVIFYKLFFKDSGEVIAYFSLANDSIHFDCPSDKCDMMECVSPLVDANYRNHFGQQTSFPAVNIAHLAVNIRFQRQGFGSDILQYICEVYRSPQSAGCQFVTVDALNTPEVNGFYMKNGFDILTDNDSAKPTRRLYRSLLHAD